MKTFVKKKLHNHFSKNRQSFTTRLCMKFSRFVQGAYFNSSNHDIESNGERLVFEAACAVLGKEPVVFDVGANTGEWIRMAFDVSPKMKGYCFEVVPVTREELVRNLPDPGITVLDYGLADQECVVPIKYYPNANTGSSLYDLPWSQEASVIDCRCSTGDVCLSELSLGGVDFLKIDVEGADYQVLEGFKAALESGKIQFIQFEYNKAAVLSQRMLRDFYLMLEGLGFHIGRIHPNGCEFKEYDLFSDENLLQGNFLAVSQAVYGEYLNAQANY